MSQPLKKTRYRCSKQQKNMLVAHMVSVGDLSSSSALKSPKAQEALSASWEALAAKLAEVGPAKSVEQWKITWRDLKCKARAFYGLVNTASSKNAVEFPPSVSNDNINLINKIQSILSTEAQHLASTNSMAPSVEQPESPSGDSIKEGGPVDPFSEISQDKPSLEEFLDSEISEPEILESESEDNSESKRETIIDVDSATTPRIIVLSQKPNNKYSVHESSAGQIKKLNHLPRIRVINFNRKPSCRDSHSQTNNSNHNTLNHMECKNTSEHEYKTSQRIIHPETRTSSTDSSVQHMISPMTEAGRQYGDTLASINTFSSKRQTDDEYDHFGHIIASKLRKIPDMNEREVVMHSVYNVVYKALIKDR